MLLFWLKGSEIPINSVRNRDFFSQAWGVVGLNDFMKISLVLVIFSLAQLNFHRLRTPGQLLRSHTVKTIQGRVLNLGLVVIPEHTY